MSSVTGNTTQSFGIIKYVCDTPYIMLIAQLERKPWPSQAFKQTMNSQGRCFAHTFALICVFVKNCLCRYNFPIPMRKTKPRKTGQYILITYIDIFAHIIVGRDLALLKNICLILLERFFLSLQFKRVQSAHGKHWSLATSHPSLLIMLHSQHKCHCSKDFRISTLVKRILSLS